MRALFEARGEILSVPAEKGDFRNLTTLSGIAERDPAWSPDGKWIAYFSDEAGVRAALRGQRRPGDVKKNQSRQPALLFYSPNWSPDSKKIVYTDNGGTSGTSTSIRARR